MTRENRVQRALVLAAMFAMTATAALAQRHKIGLSDEHDGIQAEKTFYSSSLGDWSGTGVHEAAAYTLGYDDWEDEKKLAPSAMSFADWNDDEPEPIEDVVCCDSCPRSWARLEYLLWWTKGNPLPPLLTTSNAGTPVDAAGVLPGAQVLFGGTDIDNDARHGFRVSAGHWLNECTSIEAVYFSVFDDNSSGDLAAQTAGVIGGGAGLPILARPFRNAVSGLSDSNLISYPGIVDGAIRFSSNSEMHSASALLRKNFVNGCRGKLDLIGGYRYFRYREGLLIEDLRVVTGAGGPGPAGTTFEVFDHFVTENDFHGGELGVSAEFWHDIFTIELLAKVALGNVHRELNINGGTRITNPTGATTSAAGGFQALSTNIGRYTENDFAALPEFGVNVNVQANRSLSLFCGYTLLMLNDVARTGEHIDSTINQSYLPGNVPMGPARPSPLLANETDFWAMGFNAGFVWER